MPPSKGWVGCDLDGTLAYYDGWKGVDHIGPPIPAMVARVKQWLAEGKDVRIFTARVDGSTELDFNGDMVQVKHTRDEVAKIVQAWCKTHIGQALPVTNCKDAYMLELWDDRCVQVEKNTGRVIGESRMEPTLFKPEEQDGKA